MSKARTIRLALIPDFPEEGWPSMDLAAEMLLREVSTAVRLVPKFRRRFQHLPWIGSKHVAFNADRLLNRHFDLPRHLRRHLSDFDLFHVVDHSYAHVVHVLPPGRTGVFCHDLDAFRCLLEPQREPRPRWFRALAQSKLSGLQRAAIVFYSTGAVREQIDRHGMLDPARLVHAPYGVSEEFTPYGPATSSDPPYLLHVGSCIPRKRIDVLLEVVARVRITNRAVRLVKIGGEWSLEQRQQIDRLGLTSVIEHRTNLDRAEIANYYRGAALVVLPSEAEGFGLPLIEALACGAPVLASDLPVLREVGGTAVVYRPVGDVEAWETTVRELLSHPEQAPSREVRAEQAARFSWAAHAATILRAYERLADSS